MATKRALTENSKAIIRFTEAPALLFVKKYSRWRPKTPTATPFYNTFLYKN